MENTAELTGTDAAPELRNRARQLIELAAQIERSSVMTIPDHAVDAAWHTPRARLCDVLLERNLHQLHQVADDLRQTALQFLERAEQLEPSVGSAA